MTKPERPDAIWTSAWRPLNVQVQFERQTDQSLQPRTKTPIAQLNLCEPLSNAGSYHCWLTDLIMAVLAAVVIDIVERVEEGGRVWVQRLHDFIRHTAYLQSNVYIIIL